MYKIYKITNTVNNKSYIGMTKNSVEKRWEKHLADSKCPLYPIHRAISKYGSEKFTIEILIESDNRQFIADSEQFFIDEYKSHISKNGYNVARGGYGGDLGSEINAKRRQTILNFSREKKQEISEKIKLKITGSTRTEETKIRMSELQLAKGGYGPEKHSDKTKDKISKANTGKVRSVEARQTYSENAKLRGTGPQLQGKKVGCLCCNKEWDIGNYTQHIKRMTKNELQ